MQSCNENDRSFDETQFFLYVINDNIAKLELAYAKIRINGKEYSICGLRAMFLLWTVRGSGFVA